MAVIECKRIIVVLNFGAFYDSCLFFSIVRQKNLSWVSVSLDFILETAKTWQHITFEKRFERKIELPYSLKANLKNGVTISGSRVLCTIFVKRKHSFWRRFQSNVMEWKQPWFLRSSSSFIVSGQFSICRIRHDYSLKPHFSRHNKSPHPHRNTWHISNLQFALGLVFGLGGLTNIFQAYFRGTFWPSQLLELSRMEGTCGEFEFQTCKIQFLPDFVLLTRPFFHSNRLTSWWQTTTFIIGPWTFWHLATLESGLWHDPTFSISIRKRTVCIGLAKWQKLWAILCLRTLLLTLGKFIFKQS